MDKSPALLETTLHMLGAEKYLKSFNKYGIDSSVLPLLTDDDLKIIGVDDDQLRNKFIKQCSNLPLISDKRIDLTVNDKYLITVLNDMDRHLLLLDASLSYALNNKNLKLSDVKLSKASQTLLSCTESFQKELHSFHHLFDSGVKKKKSKWKLALLAIISASLSVYSFQKFLKR